MAQSRTIQIVLTDGSPQGIRIAEIENRSLVAIAVPRHRFKEAVKREELHKPGLYFLFGSPADENKPMAYVGEAEPCHERLKNHHLNKEFWNVALAVTSQTDKLNKTKIRYLEWLAVTTASAAGRYALENTAKPKQPHVSEFEHDALTENFEDIRLLASALGFPIFEPLAGAQDSDQDAIFYCRSKQKNVGAKGRYSDDGFVILKGSTAVHELAPTASKYAKRLRKKLIDQGVLKDAGDHFVFVADQAFNAPSAAAAAVLGRNANGWTKWKDADGQSLKDVYQDDSDGS